MPITQEKNSGTQEGPRKELKTMVQPLDPQDKNLFQNTLILISHIICRSTTTLQTGRGTKILATEEYPTSDS